MRRADVDSGALQVDLAEKADPAPIWAVLVKGLRSIEESPDFVGSSC
jgi:hypothetical protein